MRIKYSLVIFDLDGTLADTHQLIFDSFNHILEKYRSTRLTPKEIMSYFGPPEEVCIKNMLGAESFEAGWSDYLKYYKDHLNETSLFPGIPGILKDLRASGARLGVFTGKGKETTELTLSYHGIADYFDIVVTGSRVKNHKPHPEGVELTLKRLHVDAAEAVVVGDSLSDYKAAASAGTNFIAAVYDKLANSKFINLACTRADSVSDLSKLLFVN